MTSKAIKKKVVDDFPPVSAMVIESIKALKDPPRKGSTLRSIKETISLNWPVSYQLMDTYLRFWALYYSLQLPLVNGSRACDKVRINLQGIH